MERSIDRYVEGWARGLLLLIDGKVRKLTEEELDAVGIAQRRTRRSGH